MRLPGFSLSHSYDQPLTGLLFQSGATMDAPHGARPGHPPPCRDVNTNLTLSANLSFGVCRIAMRFPEMMYIGS